MSITATLAGMILLGQTPPETKVYRNENFGLEFSYPASWIYRKERLYEVIEIPLASGGTAEVQVFSTYFRQSAEQWQAVQADVAETLGRTIDRQWQEVILGAPLLLTRMFFVRSGEKMSTQVGLLYSATPEKLNYRLTVAADKAEEAETAWRNALGSLRTVSGDLPGVEDPSRPGPIDNPTRGSEGDVFTDKRLKFPTIKTRRDEKFVEVEAQGSAARLKLPREWSVTADGESYLLQREDGLKGTLKLTLNLGSTDDAKAAVVQGAANTLGEFTKVGVREDWAPKFTDGGAVLNGVVRKGTKGEGEGTQHVVLFASGSRALYFWVAEYRAESFDDLKADMKHLERVFDYLLVEARQ